MEHLKEWFALPDETKKNIFNQTGNLVGLPAYTIEKDWLVAHTLALIFSMECSQSLLFKGGTSLSKGWGLIQRFSEDIDLAMDREYLGFSGELNPTQIKNLRRDCFNFCTTSFFNELDLKFKEAGFKDVRLEVRESPSKDQDPVIEIYHHKLTEPNTYLKPDVQVEISSRSLKEPFSTRSVVSWVGEKFTGRPFADKPITIPIVNPERTLLEKIFLLQEEFQKKEEKMRVYRMSRHLYDIEKLSRTEYAKLAFEGPELFQTIVAHRRKFNAYNFVDYDKHRPGTISFLPPQHLLAAWEADYKDMQENMIHEDPSLSFPDLIKKLSEFQLFINQIKLPESE